METQRRDRRRKKATSWLVALLALATVTGCAGQRRLAFLNTTHRENYALQPEELRRVQFFVSEEVLAHELGEAGALAGLRSERLEFR